MSDDDVKYAVVTGVSSGIGYAVVKELIGRGYFVFGSVRKQEDADRLAAEFDEGEFGALVFDITDPAGIAAAVAEVAEEVEGIGLWGLVNNAGIAVAGPLMHVTPEEMRRQFEVNVIGTLAVTQAFLPLLGARRDAKHPPGRIVNISSVSGHIAYPFMGPYAASKHALEAMSDALRRELLLYGVDVIVVAPGSVNTPIWDKAEQEYGALAPGTDYDEVGKKFLETATKLGRESMPVERVSRTVLMALESPKPKPRYILSNNRVLGWLLPRWMPTRMYDRIIASQMGLIGKG